MFIDFDGVRVSSGLMLFDIKSSILGFIALRAPFIGAHVTGPRPLWVTETAAPPS